MKNNIDKKISYENSGTKNKKISSNEPTQLELPLDNPNSNVIPFPFNDQMPIINSWWKANKKKIKNKQIVSVDDLGPYLTNFFDEKKLLQMSEQEIEALLQDLLEKGLI